MWNTKELDKFLSKIYLDILEDYMNDISLVEQSKILGIPWATLYKKLIENYKFKEIQILKNKKDFNENIKFILNLNSNAKLKLEYNHTLTFEEWGGVKNKYYFLCSQCKTEWKHVVFDQIKQSKSCICRKCFKENAKEFNKIDFNYMLNEVNIIGSNIRKRIDFEITEKEWTRIVDKYWFTCNSCKLWFHKEYRQFIKRDGGKCTDCKGHVIKWSIEKVKKYCESINSGFLSDTWNSVNRKYKFKCTECTNEINKSFTKFYSGQNKCDECVCKHRGDTTRKTHEEYIAELKNKNIDIIPVEKYINSNTAIKHICPKCNKKDWYVLPDNIINRKSKSCMNCRTSEGEDIITNFLLTNNILFKREYTIDDLKSSKNYLLRFDFAVFNNINELYMIIEFDGEHHYRPVSYSKTCDSVEKFITMVSNDELKNNYCILNNIYLLRIPYWEKENIEEILSNDIKFKKLFNKENLNEEN